MTILPIFRPRARVSERSPLAVGWASRITASSEGAVSLLFLTSGPGDATGKCVLRTGLISAESSLATVLTGGVSSSASTIVFFTPWLLVTTVFFPGTSSLAAEQLSESEAASSQAEGLGCESAGERLFGLGLGLAPSFREAAATSSLSLALGGVTFPELCASSLRTSITSRGGSDFKKA